MKEKEICVCGHLKGSHSYSSYSLSNKNKQYVYKCDRKVKGRLCPCKKYIPNHKQENINSVIGSSQTKSASCSPSGEKIKGISEKEFEKFTNEMWKRLKEGEKKYGTSFKTKNIQKEMLAEAVDLSNYSFMLYLQAVKFNKNNKT